MEQYCVTVLGVPGILIGIGSSASSTNRSRIRVARRSRCSMTSPFPESIIPSWYSSDLDCRTLDTFAALGDNLGPSRSVGHCMEGSSAEISGAPPIF